ncbi:hypothetical protein ANCCAN_25931 [Ancylostoma caninum]|uniref:Uncharacterized protein n=1 Tax=Ancylostoma caninum TaxID=29170 RepID=A0A368F9Q0_ANCCA|nr:hypothetical protein ANCCAN_25931 [Ancylostoma caninum]
MRRRFCRHLAQRLAEARLGMALVDDSFYEINLCNFTSIDPSDVQQATGLPLKEVTKLLECLFANAMRFFVLYCVHALRNQVFAKFSKSGEAFFRLKILDSTSISSPWTVDGELNSFGLHFRFCISDEEMSTCIPLGELHSPTLEDLQGESDCASLVYQVRYPHMSQVPHLRGLDGSFMFMYRFCG